MLYELSLNAHPLKYSTTGISFLEALPVVVLSAFPYAQRHYQLSNQADCKHVWGHRTLAVLEALPVVGVLFGLIERIVAFVGKVFHKEPAQETVAPALRSRRKVKPQPVQPKARNNDSLKATIEAINLVVKEEAAAQPEPVKRAVAIERVPPHSAPIDVLPPVQPSVPNLPPVEPPPAPAPTVPVSPPTEEPAPIPALAPVVQAEAELKALADQWLSNEREDTAIILEQPALIKQMSPLFEDPSLDPQEVLERMQKGRWIMQVLLRTGKEGWSKISENLSEKDLRDHSVNILWYLAYFAAKKNQLFHEGAYVLVGEKPGEQASIVLDSIKRLFGSKGISHDRISTHLPERSKQAHQGLDVPERTLPGNFGTILYATIDESADQSRKLFIKPEPHGVGGIWDFVLHAKDTVRSYGRKVWILQPIFGTDQDGGARKERVPPKLLHQFSTLLSQLPAPNDASEITKRAKIYGISEMYRVARQFASDPQLSQNAQSQMNAFVQELQKKYDHLQHRTGEEVVVLEEEILADLTAKADPFEDALGWVQQGVV